jgi:hypothetical protein
MSTIAPPRPRSRRRGGTPTPARPAPLATYADDLGTGRELVCVAGAPGTRLVIDQLLDGTSDRRLLAHLAADEPAENAAHVVAAYLAAPRVCRSLMPADLRVALGEGASSNGSDDRSSSGQPPLPERVLDRRGAVYELAPVRTSPGIAQLRWTRRPGEGGPAEVVSVRAVVGALESYEPVLGLTRAAVARHERDEEVSVALLRAEHERATASPIVLNRGLREAVQELLARGEASISEIAIRCGRVKHGPRGTLSGETSWLARRIGQAPEAGRTEPTPWIHTDVLALIAREGLCLAPRDVEV